MKEQNGIQIFEDGEQPALPDHLSKDIEVLSTYGFKIVDRNGKEMWAVATEEDYKASESQRLGVPINKVKAKRSNAVHPEGYCAQTGPTTCSGICTDFFCTLIYNPAVKYYYCGCT